MARVYLSLGSNLGNRKATLRKAVEILKANPYFRLRRISSLYETEPQDFKRQRKFFNIVLAAETSLSPHELLELCQSTENIMGRQREIEKGPRVIDVDILLYDSEETSNSLLLIPHPRLKERAFVLIPLLEIAPQLALPSGVYLSSFLGKVEGQQVKRIGNLYS
jgi:2-amino-4-hydroxy-6-hydroxymethyldihydropteridine diphosphokinase